MYGPEPISVPPTAAQYTLLCSDLLQAANLLRSCAGIYTGHGMTGHSLTVAAHCERLCEMLRSLLAPGDRQSSDADLRALLRDRALPEPKFLFCKEDT